MSELYDKVGEHKPSYLLADPTGAEKVSVSVSPVEGTIKRGTILYRGADSLYKAAEAANITATSYLVVLDEDVTIESGETVAPTAAAYRAGRLVRSKVTVGGTTAVTAAQEVVLRGQGIVLSLLAEDAAEITNSTT